MLDEELDRLVLSQFLTALAQERQFFTQLNRELANHADWPDVDICLSMIDSRDGATFAPTQEFQSYAQLSRYLRWIDVYPCSSPPAERARLGQRREDRPSTGVFPKSREVKTFADELAHYARRLGPTDFTGPSQTFTPSHSAVVTTHTGYGPAPQRTHGIALAEKLDESAYERRHCSELWLAVHNFPQEPAVSMRLWHPYWHHMDAAVAKLRGMCQGQTKFDRIYFVDFSKYGGAKATVFALWSADDEAPRAQLPGQTDGGEA